MNGAKCKNWCFLRKIRKILGSNFSFLLKNNETLPSFLKFCLVFYLSLPFQSCKIPILFFIINSIFLNLFFFLLAHGVFNTWTPVWTTRHLSTVLSAMHRNWKLWHLYSFLQQTRPKALLRTFSFAYHCFILCYVFDPNSGVLFNFRHIFAHF